MPTISLVGKESLSWLRKVVTTPWNIEYLKWIHFTSQETFTCEFSQYLPSCEIKIKDFVDCFDESRISHRATR